MKTCGLLLSLQAHLPLIEYRIRLLLISCSVSVWLRQMLTTLQWSWTIQWEISSSTNLRIKFFKAPLCKELFLHPSSASTYFVICLSQLSSSSAGKWGLTKEGEAYVMWRRNVFIADIKGWQQRQYRTPTKQGGSRRVTGSQGLRLPSQKV